MSAEIHDKVQAALDWQLPSNDCKKPKFTGNPDDILAHGGYISHTPTNTTEVSAGTPMVFEIDHYKIERYKRKRTRWESCVSRYKSELLQHFEVLKSSAQYGLTQPQAEAIMGNLALIQAAVISPDGKVKAK